MRRVIELSTPISESEINTLQVGDIVYVRGIVITARDLTHRKIIDAVKKGLLKRDLFEGNVIYHAGPVVRRRGESWEVVSVGPTTSIRMDKLTPKLVALTGVKLIVGKGGMGRGMQETAVKYKCAYGIFPGGCGIVAAKCVKRVVDVYFLDELGIPEAMWVLEVENFGPIVVTIDSSGRVL